MNVRLAFICIVATALLSSGCVYPLEKEGADGQYNAISLALSLKSPGDVPEGPATKMSSVITQDGTGFRGIEQVYVIPFLSANPVDGGSSRWGDRNVFIQNPSIGTTGLIANNNAHLYNIAIIPKSMNWVLAYGKAANDGSVSTKEGKHKNGVLTPSAGLDNPNTPGDISFHLEEVLEADDLTYINQKSDNMIAALNGVVEQLQASKDADIRAFLEAFTSQNEITACSYQNLYHLEHALLGALSMYSGTNSTAINALMVKISALQAARNAAGPGFPTTYGIPEGALGMWWNGHRFVKLIDGVNISLVPVTEYCYPPSLWYYANSPVKTSAKENVKDKYNDPYYSTWSSILVSTYTEGTIVQSSTRSVAIVDQLEYGVGLVEFRFTPIGSAVLFGGCPLKGIIIGDQKDVDYSFAPNGSKSHFVYDNTISGITLSGIKPDGTSQYVQMLVLPTADNQTVHFALEFENNTSSAFQCQQGTVQPNCRFYLAGELVPGKGTKPDGESIIGVFDSDYKTTVNVRISDLRKAYNTVPDLRSPQLELGVVAEMDWIQLEPGKSKLSF